MIRFRAVFVRVLAVLSIVGILAGSTGLHMDRDDVLCDIGPIHDPSAHRIGPGSTRTAPEPTHCFLCHWLRSVRSALTVSDTCELTITRSSAIVSVDRPRHSRLVATSLVPRAPPA